ncbi:MAG TPA: energy transducer TonB [Candidatus Sulfotelmatobacter sp.]
MSQRTTATLLAALMMAPVAGPAIAQSQTAQSEEMLRRAKTKVQPAYPDLARRMNITGTVKIEVVVLPNGTVKEARVVGGHPVLSGAALEAAKKWRFEPSAAESSGIIDFKFEPR